MSRTLVLAALGAASVEARSSRHEWPLDAALNAMSAVPAENGSSVGGRQESSSSSGGGDAVGGAVPNSSSPVSLQQALQPSPAPTEQLDEELPQRRWPADDMYTLPPWDDLGGWQQAYVVVELIVAFGNCAFLSLLGVFSLVWIVKYRHGCARPSPSAGGEYGGDDKAAVLLPDVGPQPPKGLTKGELPSLPTISLIIPCLLDHEAPIIEETIRVALGVLELSEVVLSYNCRVGVEPPADVLEELSALAAADSRLILLHNVASRSKAANMNAALPVLNGEFTIIIDADHHITQDFVTRSVGQIRASSPDVACVQGCVLVRGPGCWEQAISGLNWYFFSLVLTAFEGLCGTCMFIGAGAVWRTRVLVEFGFSENVIAEDDDLSMRVIRKGLNVNVCPLAEVTELAPVSFYAFCSQRLRWTFGYEQSANRHVCRLFCDRPIALLQRLYPWFCYSLVYMGITQGILAGTIPGGPPSSVWLSLLPIFIIGAPCVFIALSVFYMLRANQYRAAAFLWALLPMAIIYAFLQAGFFVYARVRMLCHFEWKVTQRKLDTPKDKKPPPAK